MPWRPRPPTALLDAILVGLLMTAVAGQAGSAGSAGRDQDRDYHAHLAKLLRHAMDAASLFIPPHWSDSFPEPLSTPELAERWGYPFESWQVETADGHILMLHRVPRKGRPGVLMLHGLFCSSADWLLAGPDRSLAFQLYEAGYDVWLANFRGNPYSMGHRDITTLQTAFWNYSFHEQGVMDLRAMLTEVHANTRAPVTVVAHSLGCTALLALLSELPDYNAMVLHAVLLGPAASMRGVSLPILRIVAHYGVILGRALHLLGLDQVLVMGSMTSRLFSLACHPRAPTAHLCKLAVFALAGHSPDLFDAELLPQIFIQCSSGTSVRTLVHLSECLVAEAFIKSQGRGQRSEEPAEEYNLSAVSAPLTLVYAKNDLISGSEEAMWLHSKTKNVSSVYEVPHATFNHLDYLYASDTSFIYDFVLADVSRRRHGGGPGSVAGTDTVPERAHHDKNHDATRDAHRDLEEQSNGHDNEQQARPRGQDKDSSSSPGPGDQTSQRAAGRGGRATATRHRVRR